MQLQIRSSTVRQFAEGWNTASATAAIIPTMPMACFPNTCGKAWFHVRIYNVQRQVFLVKSRLCLRKFELFSRERPGFLSVGLAEHLKKGVDHDKHIRQDQGRGK
jgi:hypothetical protein